MEIKVRVREKKISEGRLSLYLDYYPEIVNEEGKKTRREFLKKYVWEKPKNAQQRQHNKETRQLVEGIRRKRENQYNKDEIYSEFEKEQLKIREKGERDFVEYFKSLMRKRTNSNYDSWNCTLNYLNDFTGGTLKFADLKRDRLQLGFFKFGKLL